MTVSHAQLLSRQNSTNKTTLQLQFPVSRDGNTTDGPRVDELA